MPAPTFTDGDAAVARRYDTWFDTSWRAQEWAVETALVAGERLPVRATVSPLLERARRLAPRFGAVRILTVEVAR